MKLVFSFILIILDMLLAIVYVLLDLLLLEMDSITLLSLILLQMGQLLQLTKLYKEIGVCPVLLIAVLVIMIFACSAKLDSIIIKEVVY